jgi:hypothetical protein
MIRWLALFVSLAAAAAGADYGNARALVNRTVTDLRRSADIPRKDNDQRKRVENADRRLSDFDRHLRKGKFDKDKLDGAIEDVKHVIDHNTLSPEDRDALSADLRDLRELRSRRGAGY